MSGPIVRKYGFPNFEKIFGKRPLEHGVDDEGQSDESDDGKKGAKKELAPTKELKRDKS
jgi:hypothetical protein